MAILAFAGLIAVASWNNYRLEERLALWLLKDHWIFVEVLYQDVDPNNDLLVAVPTNAVEPTHKIKEAYEAELNRLDSGNRVTVTILGEDLEVPTSAETIVRDVDERWRAWVDAIVDGHVVEIAQLEAQVSGNPSVEVERGTPLFDLHFEGRGDEVDFDFFASVPVTLEVTRMVERIVTETETATTGVIPPPPPRPAERVVTTTPNRTGWTYRAPPAHEKKRKCPRAPLVCEGRRY